MVERTALAGMITMEINCLPVENAEYRRIMDRRAEQAMKPKRETKLLTGIISSHGGNLLAPGTLGSSGNFNTFIVRNQVQPKFIIANLSRKMPDPTAERCKIPKLRGYPKTSYWT